MNYTPTQRRILAVLEDGQAHKVSELMECLNDDMAERVTLRGHICALRKKLRPIGENIHCELGGTQVYYRRTRLVSVDE